MKKHRILAAALCAAALLCGFAAPAYAYADGGGATGGYDPEPRAVETPAPEPNPFTPSGTGTVVDNATDEDGKEFFTIQTPAENVFYLVIDRQRGTENVYFLNAVTEADLLALAELPEEPVAPSPTPTPEPAPDDTPEPTPQPEQKQGGNMGMLLLVAAVVLIGGGAAFYFKVYRPKHQTAAPEEDYDESEPFDVEAPWDEDGDSTGEPEE